MTIFIGVYLYYLFTITLDQVSLTSSISGRNACPSEEVTFTCTAQGPALFWGNEAFGERTMHYESAPSSGDFRAEIVSYDRNQSCLVSSLGFCATASRNGTSVTCTSRDRSSNESLSLHIMSSEWFFSNWNHSTVEKYNVYVVAYRGIVHAVCNQVETDIHLISLLLCHVSVFWVVSIHEINQRGGVLL